MLHLGGLSTHYSGFSSSSSVINENIKGHPTVLFLPDVLYGSEIGFLGLFFPYDVRLVRKVCGLMQFDGENTVLRIFTTCDFH